MKQFYSYIKISSIIFLTLIFLQSNSYGQRAYNEKPESSNQGYKRDLNNSSNSTVSEASDRGFEKKRFNNRNDWLDQYRHEKDSYPRDDKNRNYNDYTERRDDRRNTNENYTENYFHIDRSGRTLWDGKHWDIDDFPLKVYVKESSSKYYKSVYKDYVNYAFDLWNKADDRINYTLVKNRREADLSIIFIENLGRKYDENYLGLTEYDLNRNNEIEYSKIQISLLKFGTEIVSDGEVKATIIHELGHALGLGHSDNERDIMYPYIHSDHTPLMKYNELSHGDKEAVQDCIDLGDSELYAWK